MASSEDKRSKTQTSFGKILNTLSAVPECPEEQTRQRQDEELEGQVLLARSMEIKRGLLEIDLNVAPPEDGGPESPEAEDGVVGEEIRHAAVAIVSKEIVNFNEIVGVHDEAFKVNSENRDKIEEQMVIKNTVLVSEKEKKEMRKNRRLWDALLEAATNALRDYEEGVGNKEGKTQNRKRRPCREVGIGGELRKGTAWKKTCNGAAEFMAAAPMVLARSTRARAVAMPSKYRDSVLHAAAAVAEARLSRHNVKRKFR